jgi:hypothetical protein
MKHTICNQVRQEFEVKDLKAALSAVAVDHLRDCHECQELRSKDTKLRQIIGSLEPVAAPADFDFRLRARLANDRSASYRSMAPVRVWRMRSAAVAAMLLIFAATVLVLRQNQGVRPADNNAKVGSIAEPNPPDKGSGVATATPSVKTLGGTEESTPLPPVKRTSPGRQFVAKSKGPTATRDSADTPAPVVSLQQSFPLDVPQPSYKVSLDDGRGSSRTISVPSVSFGSRRVLSTNVANPYASKGDW